MNRARGQFQSAGYQQACEVSGEIQRRNQGAGSELSDAELIQSSLDGRFDCFEELVSRYERKAFWIAWQVLGRVEESRDVVQEAFVRVYRSLDRFDFSRNFYTWLFRIVTNLSIDSLRKLRSDRSIQLVDDEGDPFAREASRDPDPGMHLEGKELAQDVRDVLDRIPPRFRTILALRDLHQISCREIAPILGLTYPTVRWRLHKARQLFKERWERRLEKSARRRVRPANDEIAFREDAGSELEDSFSEPTSISEQTSRTEHLR